MAGHTAPSGHAGSLQIGTAFLRGQTRLSRAETNAVVGAYLTLGPDIPLGKLLIRTRCRAVHHCKG